MCTSYPHWHDLSESDRAQSAPLWIGAEAMRGLHEQGYFKRRPSDRPPSLKARRPACSPYVGVTLHRDRWIAQYGPRGRTKTKVFPLTPDGERGAAVARSLALGLDYIPMRDGRREGLS